MSKKLFFLSALLLGAMTMFAPACGDTDACKDVECGTSGTCFEGSCVCDEGYEADADGKCNTETRVKFYGNFNTSETCGGAADTYANTISATPGDVTKINISNFGNSGLNVSATVSGTTFTIPAQSIMVGMTTTTVTGTGSISGTTITINYSGAGANPFTCTATLTR